MFGFLKAAFSMPKVIDAAISAGDALVFTDQERKDWIVESAKVLGPQTVARRVIAFVVSGVWLMATVIQGALILADYQVEDWSDLYTSICFLFGGVMAFYFGTSVLRAKNGK
jgi:hypothetical protein